MSGPKSYTLQDHVKETSLFKRRAFVTLFFVVVLMATLLGNLYYLQVKLHDNYETRSDENRIRIQPIAPTRGLVYDRNGKLLAENLAYYTLQLIPEQITDLEKTLEELNKVIPISAKEKKDLLKALKHSSPFRPVIIKDNITEEELASFSVNQYQFPGFSIEAGLKRYYPEKGLLTHVLGYVGRINAKEKQAFIDDSKWGNYAATNVIGKQGIEKYYEAVLHGQSGYQEEEINSHGRQIRTLKTVVPKAGQDLYLTLDNRLQKKAAELLDGHRGSVVALNPNDGSILAMISSPSYDPNTFVGGISNKNYQALLNNPSRPLINRATQGQYASASTIKPFMALLGLDDGAITLQTRINDPGYWQIPGVQRKYRDWKPWGHGWVDVYKAIIQSCDTFFYRLSYKLGIDKISTFLDKFGFGHSTGIDINEEYTGNLPSRGWKRAKYNEAWYLGDTVSVGIGQGYLTVTPMQLANAVATLATHGKRSSPHFVKPTPALLKAGFNPAPDLPPVTLKDPNNWTVVTEAMRRTAKRSRFSDAPYSAAMKTGTAQIVSTAQNEKYDASSLAENLRDNALIVAYAPFENPQIVLAVILENVGWGSSNAGPVARALLDEYLLNEDQKQVKKAAEEKAKRAAQQQDE